MKVGDKVLYCKVVNDFTTEELVDILNIDEESKSATIYIPTLKRERDTDLTRLYVKQVDDTVDFTLPKRIIQYTNVDGIDTSYKNTLFISNIKSAYEIGKIKLFMIQK